MQDQTGVRVHTGGRDPALPVPPSLLPAGPPGPSSAAPPGSVRAGSPETLSVQPRVQGVPGGTAAAGVPVLPPTPSRCRCGGSRAERGGAGALGDAARGHRGLNRDELVRDTGGPAARPEQPEQCAGHRQCRGHRHREYHCAGEGAPFPLPPRAGSSCPVPARPGAPSPEGSRGYRVVRAAEGPEGSRWSRGGSGGVPALPAREAALSHRRQEAEVTQPRAPHPPPATPRQRSGRRRYRQWGHRTRRGGHGLAPLRRWREWEAMGG